MKSNYKNIIKVIAYIFVSTIQTIYFAQSPKIYVIAGQNYDGTYSSNIDCYDPATNTWTNKFLLNIPRAWHTSSTVNNQIYIIGGVNSSGYPANVEMYDPNLNTSFYKSPLPTPRRGLTSSVVNNKIYVFGGYNGVLLDINESYDPATNTWTTKASMPTAREFLTSAAVNDIIYVIGGTIGFGPGPFYSNNEAYDPSTDSWTVKSPMPTPRGHLTSGVVNNIIYVIGGNNPSFLATNEAYNPTTDTWTSKKPMNYARVDMTASVVNNIIYVIGGYTNGATTVNEAYNPITNNWSNKAWMFPPGKTALSSAVAIENTTNIDNNSSFIQKLNIFPQPVKDKINITFSANNTKQHSAKIVLLDATGKIVFEKTFSNIHSGENNIQLNIPENILNGIYILKAEIDNSFASKSVVIQK
jgi:N-acetylneuraminic acid mutarotase